MTTDLWTPPQEGIWTPAPLFVSPMPEEYLTWGPDVCDWIESNCVLPQGEWLGRPFKLLPWQREWINELYAVDEDGELLFRWSLLGIPKKNGKTALAAALALYHVFGDPNENDPWAVCAGASSEQASLVFNDARRMVEYSDTLSKIGKVYRTEIQWADGRPGKLERVAASKGKLDGKNISMLICDELHEWNRDNWTVLTNGTVGRSRAQIIQITTAGWDLETICGDEYLKGMAIAKGEIENPTYNFRWYGAPEGTSVRDIDARMEANPSYGSLVTERALLDKLENTPEGEYRRYFLNQWTGAADAWLEDGLWESCSGRLTFRDDQPVWVGWDASSKRDSTAVVAVQWDGDYEEIMEAVAVAQEEAAEAAGSDRVYEDDEQVEAVRVLLEALSAKLQVYARVWQRPLDSMTGKPVEGWRVPTGEVEAYVRSIGEDFDVREVSYDPMFITWSAIPLEAQGMKMVEFPQTDSRMVQATQATYELLLRHALVHNNDAQQAQHIRDTATIITRNGGRRVAKGRGKKPMDFSVALVMAVLRAVKSLIEGTERGPSVWT